MLKESQRQERIQGKSREITKANIKSETEARKQNPKRKHMQRDKGKDIDTYTGNTQEHTHGQGQSRRVWRERTGTTPPSIKVESQAPRIISHCCLPHARLRAADEHQPACMCRGYPAGPLPCPPSLLTAFPPPNPLIYPLTQNI